MKNRTQVHYRIRTVSGVASSSSSSSSSSRLQVMDAESGELFLGDVTAGSWTPLQNWVEDPDGGPNCLDLLSRFLEPAFHPKTSWKRGLRRSSLTQPQTQTGVEQETFSSSESDDVLHGVDPNRVLDCGPPADLSSESDSGISEEVGSPVAVVTAMAGKLPPATIYQVVYDISGLSGTQTEPGPDNVVSIELGGWSSQVLLSDSCIVTELPVDPLGRTAADPDDQNLLFPELHLTEEEQKLLTEEGISLPSNLPLTKAEDRVLKKVRRKIRNKQSAQDSRRRRKEYIDGLESRAAACSAQNKELQRTVEQLENHNMSLLVQLRQLQSLIKQTVSKGAQTSTCLLILLVSLSLIILPSFSPFSRRPAADDDHRPIGVLSRNILTDPSSSLPADDGGPAVPSNSSPPLSELGQSGHPESTAVFQEPMELLGEAGADGELSQSGRSSAVVPGGTETVAENGGYDATKLAHTDEM